MKALNTTVSVMFRMDKYGKRKEVIAVFPYEESTVGKPEYRTCYAHIGQHGACSWEWVLQKTRPATVGEYTPLKQELESIGYGLRVIKRRARK